MRVCQHSIKTTRHQEGKTRNDGWGIPEKHVEAKQKEELSQLRKLALHLDPVDALIECIIELRQIGVGLAVLVLVWEVLAKSGN